MNKVEPCGPQPMLMGSDGGCPLRHAEDSSAYTVLKEHGLLETRFRLNSHTELQARPPNSTALCNTLYEALGYLALPLGGPCLLGACAVRLKVNTGFVQPLRNKDQQFEFAGEGVHCYWDPFLKVDAEPVAYGSEMKTVICHGDRAIVVVPQGFIGAPPAPTPRPRANPPPPSAPVRIGMHRGDWTGARA